MRYTAKTAQGQTFTENQQKRVTKASFGIVPMMLSILC